MGRGSRGRNTTRVTRNTARAATSTPADGVPTPTSGKKASGKKVAEARTTLAVAQATEVDEVNMSGDESSLTSVPQSNDQASSPALRRSGRANIGTGGAADQAAKFEDKILGAGHSRKRSNTIDESMISQLQKMINPKSSHKENKVSVVDSILPPAEDITGFISAFDTSPPEEPKKTGRPKPRAVVAGSESGTNQNDEGRAFMKTKSLPIITEKSEDEDDLDSPPAKRRKRSVDKSTPRAKQGGSEAVHIPGSVPHPEQASKAGLADNSPIDINSLTQEQMAALLRKLLPQLVVSGGSAVPHTAVTAKATEPINEVEVKELQVDEPEVDSDNEITIIEQHPAIPKTTIKRQPLPPNPAALKAIAVRMDRDGRTHIEGDKSAEPTKVWGGTALDGSGRDSVIPTTVPIYAANTLEHDEPNTPRNDPSLPITTNLVDPLTAQAPPPAPTQVHGPALTQVHFPPAPTQIHLLPASTQAQALPLPASVQAQALHLPAPMQVLPKAKGKKKKPVIGKLEGEVHSVTKQARLLMQYHLCITHSFPTVPVSQTMITESIGEAAVLLKIVPAMVPAALPATLQTQDVRDLVGNTKAAFRNEVKKAARATCKECYGLDAEKLAKTLDPEIVPVVEALLTNSSFLLGPPTPESDNLPTNFTHPAVRHLISTFFYGKHNSVGTVFSAQLALAQVPDAMLALASAALCNALEEFKTGKHVNIQFSCGVIKMKDGTKMPGYGVVYDRYMRTLKTMQEKYIVVYQRLKKTTEAWIEEGRQRLNFDVQEPEEDVLTIFTADG